LYPGNSAGELYQFTYPWPSWIAPLASTLSWFWCPPVLFPGH